MIYTIGNTESYEKAFIENGDVFKKGKTDDYEGGSVWMTEEEARNNCPSGYSVYGVKANWEDTVNTGNPWNDLLVDSVLVRIS